MSATTCSISADIGKQAIAKVNKKINFHLLRIIKSNFACTRNITGAPKLLAKIFSSKVGNGYLKNDVI